MSMDLLSKHCRPVAKGSAPLREEALEACVSAVSERWKVMEYHHLEGTFKFDDFQGALEFTNRAAEVAEAEGHHPEITLTWGKVTVRIWTHSIDGLSENDFILAARLDALEG
jgi:4a-hydroxytetrahydrobiopterin dehydratase